MELSEKQLESVNMVLEGKSLAILGQAGTGKSAILKETLPRLKGVFVCASSASAAMGIGFGATTAHSLFGLRPQLYTPRDYNKKISSELAKRLRKIEVLVVEEVGLLRRDTLEMMDYRLRKAKKTSLPFGGIQVIMIGDGLQLPPVVANTEKKHFYSNYKSAWFFTSPSFKWLKIVYLTEVFRQLDTRQQRILKSIRNKDKYYKAAINRINTEATPYNPKEGAITLCSYNKDANRYNNYWYNKNTNEEFVYTAQDKGLEKFNYQFPVSEEIALKVGVKVKICANSPDSGYYNGMTGMVKELHEDFVVVEVGGASVFVSPFKFEVLSYKVEGDELIKNIISSREQMPIKLAYGVTIHSSQGMTLDKVNIDFGWKTMANNIAYVALSRVRDLTNLSLVRPLRPDDILVDEEALGFFKSLEEKEIGNNG